MNHSLEIILDKIFRLLRVPYSKLPAFGPRTLKYLVKIMPVFVLLLAAMIVIDGWDLLQFGRTTDTLINYSCPPSSLCPVLQHPNTLNILFWIGLVALALDAVVLLNSYKYLTLKDIKGWHLVFLASLLYALFGGLYVLGDRKSGLGRLFFCLGSSLIFIYFLFQYRRAFHEKDPASKNPG